MTSGSGLARLLDVAVNQHGFITPESSRQAGVDPTQLRIMASRDQLERWGWGLYRIPQLPITEQTELAGAVLLVGHDAAISHESALVLNDLTDANPAKVNVTVPSAYRARRSGLERIKIWRDDLARGDVTFVEGIRATTLWRTIRDCHVTGTDPTLLRQALTDGAARGLLNHREREQATRLVNGARA